MTNKWCAYFISLDLDNLYLKKSFESYVNSEVLRGGGVSSLLLPFFYELLVRWSISTGKVEVIGKARSDSMLSCSVSFFLALISVEKSQNWVLVIC